MGILLSLEMVGLDGDEGFGVFGVTSVLQNKNTLLLYRVNHPSPAQAPPVNKKFER
jgi:hypothetical protein